MGAKAQDVWLSETYGASEGLYKSELEVFTTETSMRKWEHTEKQMASIWEWVSPTIQKGLVKALWPNYF